MAQTIQPRTLPGCGRPATARFELYNHPAPGSYELMAAVCLCDRHADLTALQRATGWEPYPAPRPGQYRCGDGHDYVTRAEVHAPDGQPAEVAGAAGMLAALRDGSYPGDGPVVDAAETVAAFLRDLIAPSWATTRGLKVAWCSLIRQRTPQQQKAEDARHAAWREWLASSTVEQIAARYRLPVATAQVLADLAEVAR